MESPKQFFLVVVQGDNLGERYPLKNGINTLGRSPENIIVIDTLQISRRHIRLSPAVGSFAIEDVGSTNGTWVNGERLSRPHILVPGDEVQFAGNFVLRFDQQMAQLPEEMRPPRAKPATSAPASPARQPKTTPVAPDMALVVEQSASDTDTTPQQKSTPAWLQSVVEEKPKRKRGRFVLIMVLLLLIIAALIAAVYIWGSPPEFWEQLLGLFNIPVP